MNLHGSQIVALISSLLISVSAFAGKDLSLLGAGAPNLIDQGHLASGDYLPLTVAKLANPKLVWVNVPLLRDMGYEIPDVIDHAIEQKLLGTLAWVAVDRNLAPGDVTDEQKTMLSDFYGGGGLGPNKGGARAASAGDVQGKGIGITGHLVLFNEKHTARSTLHEAIKDSVWGEVLNNNLPFGANRIVAILDRGGSLENGEPQIVEYRVDPLRMGHFVLRKFLSDDQDVARVTSATDRLHQVLPKPAGGFPENSRRGDKIVLGMKEYARRIGIQYAHMYMRRLNHGTLSQSNIEINGRLIDFGTASAQPGFQKTSFLSYVSPFGDIEAVKRNLINSFVTGIAPDEELSSEIQKAAATRGDDWKVALPGALGYEFDTAFKSEREKLALQFSGVPEKFVMALRGRTHVAGALVRLAEFENRRSERIDLSAASTLTDQPVSLLQQVFDQIRAQSDIDEASISRAIDIALPDHLELDKQGVMKDSLKRGLTLWYADCEKYMLREGISRPAMLRLLKSNSAFITEPLSHLYLPDLKKMSDGATAAYMEGHALAPQQLIQSVVAHSLRSISQLPWNQAPVSVKLNHDGSIHVEIFDALTSEHHSMPFTPADKHFKPTEAPHKVRCENAA